MTISLALVVKLLKEFLNVRQEFGIEVEEVHYEQKQEEKKDCACNASDDDTCDCSSAECGQRGCNHICLLTLVPSLFVLRTLPHRAHP